MAGHKQIAVNVIDKSSKDPIKACTSYCLSGIAYYACSFENGNKYPLEIEVVDKDSCSKTGKNPFKFTGLRQDSDYVIIAYADGYKTKKGIDLLSNDPTKTLDIELEKLPE